MPEAATTRRYPMQKPAEHVPVIQRYSAQFPETVATIRTLFLGIQGRDLGVDAPCFLAEAQALFDMLDGPAHRDFARFIDPQGYDTVFCVAYWFDETRHRRWVESEPVQRWWTDPAKQNGPRGYFWESLSATVDNSETIAFKEYASGLSACPMSTLKPMDESGYWGAARDRLPASAHDRFDAGAAAIRYGPHPASAGERITVVVPRNLCLIRSGQSWRDCGDEQLTSYRKNVEPKLDAGMEYLRQHPEETGCLCLRQVDVIDGGTRSKKETYSTGYFLSLEHLETWAKNHPTHLAIFNRAQMERAKYQDKLELRTYHEVYISNVASNFEYVNCHGHTGLLPVHFVTG